MTHTKEVRNTATHVVDLPDGRTLAPGEVAEVELPSDHDDPVIGGMIADNTLSWADTPQVMGEVSPEPKAKGRSAAKKEGEEV